MADQPSTGRGWRSRIPNDEILATAINRDLRFEYPWDGLEAALQEEGRDRLSLVGFGSLLNPASAARTIADTPEGGHPPVLAFGARRVFDYVIPETVLQRYKSQGAAPAPPEQRAALNARWTGDVHDVMNGRLIPLALGDLDALRDREQGYDLEPVAVVPWDAAEKSPSLGFVLCATERPWHGTVFVDASVLPYPPYLRVCREGASLTGADFERCFVDTCWLADGQTPLGDWLAETPET